MKDLEKLSALLLKLAETQNKLLELEKRKTDVLVKGNIVQLEEIMRLEQPHLMNMSNIEKQRRSLQAELGLAEVPLLQIIKEHDPHNEFLFQNRYDGLSDTIRKLRKTNAMNQAILQTRLHAISEYVSMVGLRETGVTYHSNGKMTP